MTIPSPLTHFYLFPKNIDAQEMVDFSDKIDRLVEMRDESNNIKNPLHDNSYSKFTIHPTTDIENIEFGTYMYAVNGIYDKFLSELPDEAARLAHRPNANFSLTIDDTLRDKVYMDSKGWFPILNLP